MTLSAFLSVIVLLAIGFAVLYLLSIYLKYRKSSYKDASWEVDSIEIKNVVYSCKTWKHVQDFLKNRENIVASFVLDYSGLK